MSTDHRPDRHPPFVTQPPREPGLATVFTTAKVHPRDRFEFWHEMVCKRVIEYDSTPESRLGFQAELRAGALADVGIFVLHNSPTVAERTMRHVTQGSTDDFLLCCQLTGKLAFEQQGRIALLEAGDFTLLDSRIPHGAAYFTSAKLLVLKVPRRLLEARIGTARDMTARPIRPTTGANKLTSDLLGMLPARTGGLDEASRTVVENQLLDLAAISLASAAQGPRPRMSSTRSLVLMKLRTEIERRLTDPTLDVETVAAAAGVSVRYANAILATQNTSIRRFVLDRRLERCRKALEDPQQTHRTVSEIAHGWGFSDMTNFGRRFRSAYGASPREYRRNLGTR
jgi:AraC-like DNA-binding protein